MKKIRHPGCSAYWCSTVHDLRTNDHTTMATSIGGAAGSAARIQELLSSESKLRDEYARLFVQHGAPPKCPEPTCVLPAAKVLGGMAPGSGLCRVRANVTARIALPMSIPLMNRHGCRDDKWSTECGEWAAGDEVAVFETTVAPGGSGGLMGRTWAGWIALHEAELIGPFELDATAVTWTSHQAQSMVAAVAQSFHLAPPDSRVLRAMFQQCEVHLKASAEAVGAWGEVGTDGGMGRWFDPSEGKYAGYATHPQKNAALGRAIHEALKHGVDDRLVDVLLMGDRPRHCYTMPAERGVLFWIPDGSVSEAERVQWAARGRPASPTFTRGLRAILYKPFLRAKTPCCFFERHFGNKIDHEPTICGCVVSLPFFGACRSCAS